MLKPLLLLFAMGSIAVSAYYWRFAQTSYSSYTRDQLVAFQTELDGLKSSSKGATLDHEVLVSMANLELTRRERIRLFLVAGLLLMAMMLVVPNLSFGKAALDGGDGESERLQDFVGAVPKGRARVGTGIPLDKYRAAEVLGVRMDASEAIVEAAFNALLKERDPKRRVGLDPALQKHMDDQLRVLFEARDVLLSRRA